MSALWIAFRNHHWDAEIRFTAHSKGILKRVFTSSTCDRGISLPRPLGAPEHVCRNYIKFRLNSDRKLYIERGGKLGTICKKDVEKLSIYMALSTYYLTFRLIMVWCHCERLMKDRGEGAGISSSTSITGTLRSLNVSTRHRTPTQACWRRDIWDKGVAPTEQQIAACHYGHSRNHRVKYNKKGIFSNLIVHDW